VAIEFDAAKDQANKVKHGLSLARADDLEIVVAEEDRRVSYGETRYRAFGLLDGLPHCLAFTLRGDTVRALSLRRAHQKEYRRHVP
jgi:hypothetical protein